MRSKNRRGVSFMEFAFCMLVMVPLLLGTTEVGLNMINTLQTVQLARDAGHMYARGVDFTQVGNLQILASLGQGIGMSTSTGANTGNAQVILSELRYIDKATCTSDGLPSDSNGNPIGCTNLGQWVFAQRIVVGNTSMRTSTFGSPLTSGPNSVTIASDGTITLDQQCKNSGDVATFNNMISPYSTTNNTVSGLPSGQVLYLAEAEALGFKMNPYESNPMTYSYGIF